MTVSKLVMDENILKTLLGRLQGPPVNRLWSGIDICDYLGIGKETLQKLIRLDDFPKPRKLSTNTYRYNPTEIMIWADQRRV